MGLGDQLIGGVPGKPDRVVSSAKALRLCAQKMLTVREDLLTCVNDAWKGQGADKYREKVEEYRRQLLDLSTRLDTGAGALEAFASVLAPARGAADQLRAQVNALGALEALIGRGPVNDLLRELVNKAVADYQTILTTVQRAARRAAVMLLTVTNFADDGPYKDRFDGDTTPLTQDDIDRIKQDIADLGNGTYAGWDQASQHGIGDCYLLASLAALAHTPEGQAALARMVRWDEDKGAFVVTFQTEDGPVEVIVRDTYDGGLTYPATGAGLFDIIEKAYGQQFGWQDLTNGGPGAEAMSRITGGHVDTVYHGRDAAGQRDPMSAREWSRLQAAMTAGQPVVADTDIDQTTTVTDVNGTSRSVYAGHAYTVTAIGPDWIEVRNPWGNNGYPGGTYDPSPVVRMSRAEYERVFGWTEIGSTG